MMIPRICPGPNAPSGFRIEAVGRRRRARTGVPALLALALLGCRGPSPEPTPAVPGRYWMPSAGDSEAVAAAVTTLHASVAGALREVPFEPGYPRGCTVTGSPPPTGPWYPDCEEDLFPHDALKLSADTSDFLQFVTLDFPSPRVFMFEIFLLPDRSRASLERSDLWEYPRVAVPPFRLRPATYREMLAAVAAGIRAAGAEPLPR